MELQSSVPISPISSIVSNELYIPPLTSMCQINILNILKEESYHPRIINHLCKYIPGFVMEPILESIIECKAITDVALLAFLVPSRVKLNLLSISTLRNSTLKQIGLNCPNMVWICYSVYHILVCNYIYNE